MPTPYIERVIKDFRLSWGIAPRGSMKYKKGREIESFLRTALENQGKEIVGAIKNVAVVKNVIDNYSDGMYDYGYREGIRYAQKVVEDISGVKK